MKRGFLLSIMLVLIASTVIFPTSNQAFAEKNPEKDHKFKQMEILEKFEKKSGKKGLKVSWDQKRGVPDFVAGKLSEKHHDSNKDILQFVNENKDLFSLDAGQFDVIDVTKDEIGMTHYKLALKVDGIPVYGSEIIVHTNKNGIVTAMNGQVEPQLEHVKWNKRVKISKDEAIKEAESTLSFEPTKNSYSQAPTSELYLYQDKKRWLPVYQVDLQYIQPEAGRKIVFVSAVNGKVVHQIDYTQHAATTGTGVGVNGNSVTLNTYSSNGSYYLYDTTKAMNGVIRTYTANEGSSLPGSDVTDSDNNYNASSQAAAVDAHYNAGVTYDYFYNQHNRNSYDNNGSDIISTVNYSSDYNNAFWNGSQMVYGDGDGSTFIPLSGALDVVAHELAHAVTDTSASLVYQDQSGALNESYSDVFGVIVEAEAGDFDWLLGEDVYTPGTSGDALRSISNPEQYNQPAHMDDYYYTSSDNGGVHTNSGIPNKAFYYIANDIGLDKSGEIYYRSLTSYLTSQSDFMDARNALLQSAEDLYGASSPEYEAVANGYSAVGIGGSGSDPSEDTYEPNDTFNGAYGPLSSGQTYNSYISSSSDVDYYQFNSTDSGTISVSLSNLPGDYDLYLYDGSGSLLDKSENAYTNSESISYTASSSGSFYLKVVGYNGASSTSTAYALNVTYPTGTGETTAQWYYESVSADTPHPYPNNYDSGHVYSQPGAQKVAIHFSKFETEAYYDYVEVLDKNGNVTATYDGSREAFWVIVDGDEITVNLVSDYSVTKYGYTIDQVAYYNDTQLVTEGVGHGDRSLVPFEKE
jgi:bacillolysin